MYRLFLSLVFIAVILSTVDSKKNAETQFKMNIQDDYIAKYSIFNVDGQFKITNGIQENAVAIASYQGEQKYNGWAYLSINTSSSFNDSLQASAAGYLEGYLTYEMIYNSRYNYLSNQFNSTSIPEDLSQWIFDTITFMKSAIVNSTLSGVSLEDQQYWTGISLTLDQVNAMVLGYNDAASQSDNPDIAQLKIGVDDIFILNMYGDLFELIPALNLSSINITTREQLENYFHKNQHCTSMVKLTDDLSEIYAAHTTFDDYYMSIRIFKSYNFEFSQESGVVTKSILFSSYPGVVVSIDDFYQMDTGLVVLETTNSLVTNDLYHLINPQSVLYWLRIMNANRMSTSPLEWCQTFARYNSGTYNNQYQILDYKRFTPYQGINEGGLYLLEQIPGYVEYSDVTPVLRTGYTPGYNIPFYYDIYNISGYNSLNVSEYTYQGAPRGQIFRRQANDIHTIEDAKYFMRYNDFKNDPLSQGNPWYAIAARGDLADPGPSAGGGLDTKLTSYSLFKRGEVYAISGPTTSHNLPPFDWNSRDWNTTHLGLISYWDYDWVTFTNQNYYDQK
ncbi:phospholipase B-like protein [Tieghemostelium lacteum]|uniref:Phospholipase B-like n=1 Tax=Tieghemostelium lacteum TaxID=361077 RepID=A0A151ZAE8_TIELA|nr:phospholipase B-like protein [Tieghemostelium lacteum]|eukprot:KYQ90898.1 phospholipase B-like protein [Tieghemostelium lacteum]